MSTLFGAHDEQPKKRGGRRKNADEPTVDVPRVFVPSGSAVVFSAEVLGRMDDSVECLDDRCKAKCHDVVWKGSKQWRLECCFCGTGQYIPAVEEPVVEEPEPEVSEEFRFPRDSRSEFVGLTVAQVASTPAGLAYVRWASQKSASQAARDACKSFLDSLPAAS